MATRENQGLQIAVILFVMATFASLATAGWFYYSLRQIDERITATEQENARLKSSARKVADENQSLKELMGFQPDESLEKIRKDTAENQLMFGQEVPQEERKLYKLPKYLFEKIHALNDEIARLTDTHKKELAAKDKLIAKAADDYKLIVDERDKYLADLTGEREKFTAARAALAAEKAALDKRATTARAETAVEVSKRDKQIQVLEDQVKTQTMRADNAVREVKKMEKPALEKADGMITWVSQNGRSVYINLGSADDLRRQTTFSVYDENASNVNDTESKASIEVTAILSPHLAEARILRDELSNPILTGDQIYSPAWHPGQRIHFALAGFMDPDGDGVSDRTKIRSIITMNGGVIDAEVHDDGRPEGKITLNTRYLVLGDRPTEKTSAEARDNYSAFRKDASANGVEIISVEKLMAKMGVKSNERTVRLGKGARSSDFKAEPARGVAPKSTGTTPSPFRKRSAPGSARKSAY